MKVSIIKADKKKKECVKCGYDVFRKSTRSRYTNKEKTEGETYELIICDRCNYKEKINIVKWKVAKRG